MNPMAAKAARSTRQKTRRRSTRQKTRRRSTPQRRTSGRVMLARRRGGVSNLCSRRASSALIPHTGLKSGPTQATMNPLHRMRPVLLLHPPPPLPKRKNAAESSKAMKIETRTIMNLQMGANSASVNNPGPAEFTHDIIKTPRPCIVNDASWSCCSPSCKSVLPPSTR
jgi:hypothetical protein